MMVVRRLFMPVLLLATVVMAASDPDAVVRREFRQAYAAVPTATTPATDSAGLQEYILYPYLQAARLRQSLSQVARDVASVDQAIKTFLLAQNGSLASRDLRRAWLLDLAARQQWPEFLANLPNTLDAELRCLAAVAQLNGPLSAEQTASLSSSLSSLWMNGERQAAACNAPFEWARRNQVITGSMIEQRARLALKSGNTALARELAALLSPIQAEPLRQWAILIEQPQQAIDALIANPGIKIETAAMQDGWQRLARKNPDAALQRLPQLVRRRGLTTAAASPYVLSLALSLSWSRRDEALHYFERVQPADMNDQAREWRVRAALWAADWPQVQQGIQAMPEALRTQARWRYWLARADEQMDDADAARLLYQALMANDDNYYAAMAAARLQIGYAPHAQPVSMDAATMQSLARLPGMRRARELLAVQLRNEAGAEWNQVFATLQPGEHLAAAGLAHEWGWYDQAIATTARLGLYNDYPFLYPRPFDSEVTVAARRSGLSTDLIYGVMRQETLFRADAQSSANARGLLQLLPETARMTARKFDLPVPTAEELFEPTVNVPLGAMYLKSLLDAFNGQVVLAVASYNAGPAAVRRWLPAQTMETDIWIENIPYNETRHYVQRVLWHSLVFKWLRSDKPLDTRAWLAKVQP